MFIKRHLAGRRSAWCAGSNRARLVFTASPDCATFGLALDLISRCLGKCCPGSKPGSGRPRCAARACGRLRPLGLCHALGDVRTMTRSPVDADRRTRPHCGKLISGEPKFWGLLTDIFFFKNQVADIVDIKNVYIFDMQGH